MDYKKLINQAVLFEIQLDQSSEYIAEKIVFNHHNLRFLMNYHNDQPIKVIGMYGTLESISKEVKNILGEIFEFNEQIRMQKRAIICGIQSQSLLLISGIFPLDFCQTKPINEKCIEITLFRILQDLTQNIILCPSKEIIENWYDGDNIPYQEIRNNVKQYQIQANQTQKINQKQMQLKSLLKQQQDWIYVNCLNQSNLSIRYKLESSDQPLKEQLVNQIVINSILKIILNQQFRIENYLLEFSKTQQTIIAIQFGNIQSQLFEQIKINQQKLNDRLFSLFYDTFTFKDQATRQVEYSIDHISRNIFFSQDQFKIQNQMQLEDKKKQDKQLKYVQEYLETFNQLLQIYSTKLIQFIKQEMKAQNFGFKLIIEFLTYTMIRQIDNSLDSGTLSTFIDVHMDDLKIDNSKQIEVIALFDTQSTQHKILIIKQLLKEDDFTDNAQYFIYLVTKNRISKQIIKLYNIRQPCFYWSKLDCKLFIFNYNKQDVASITINKQGIVDSEKIYTIQNNKIITVKCALYSTLSRNFLLLDSQGYLYKWSLIDKFYSIPLSKPSFQIGSEIYTSLQGEEKSQYIFLATKNVVDIFDQNIKLLHSVKFQNREVKIFQDNFDIFIVQMNNNIVTALLNMSSNLQLIQTNKSNTDTKQAVGNPYFDVMKGAQICFGVSNKYKQTKLFISSDLEGSDKLQLLTDYFENKLELSKVSLLEKQATQKQYLLYLKKELNILFYQQVPLQICTIENNQIIPLIDGFKEQNPYEIKIQSLIQVAKSLSFGFFEQLTKDYINEPVFVVSIVGMQSSGKSYLMNRLFGTKFSVSASRCTDGIWMNISSIGKQHYLVLDCEGLFSPRRTEKEESQLLALLSAISDITILNQNLSFNRNLNRLFEDLTESIGKLKGDSLFKGQLMIVIRDVSKDTKGAEDELLRNILELRNRTKNKNFLEQLFCDQFSTLLLANNENMNFEKQIDEFRKEIHALCGNRNINLDNLIKKIKILLVQLQMVDNENVDQLHYQLKVDDLFNESLSQWEHFEDQKSILESENIKFNQFEIQLQNKLIDRGFQELLKYIQSKFNLKQEIAEHNSNIDKQNDIIIKLLKHRRECIINHLKKEYDSLTNYIQKAILDNKLLELDKQLTSLQNQYKICGQQCEKCYLKCQKRILHQNQVNLEQQEILQNDVYGEHDCLRESHFCDQKCEICQEVHVNCNLKSGHPNEHLCQKPDHQCINQCEIGECHNNCTKPFKHEDKHSCGNGHQCWEQCIYCESRCSTDVTILHKDHTCGSNHCAYLCCLCEENDRFCTENHYHTLLKEKNLHFCEKDHQCKQKCEQSGICRMKYKPIQMKWETKLSEFTYTFYKQTDEGKERCNVLIKAKQENHHEIQHSCKSEKHYCLSRCPECQCFCSLEFGHEGKHFSELHRNKEQQYFTTTGDQYYFEIEDKVNNSVKKYSIMESSKPETCTESCHRRGRAHFHLLACPGKTQCYQNRIQGARHQSKPYKGFETQEFDEILCMDFWAINQWDIPIQDKDDIDVIQQCNCYCPECGQNHFCTGKAWHTQSLLFQDHNFLCTENHKSMFNGLDLVFVIDSTGSMQPYINMVKERIIAIMNKAKNKINQVRSAIVAYRDHPPEDKEFVTKIQPLSSVDECLTFLNGLIADGGGDYPEAVLDGLWEGVNLDWKKSNQKVMFLIGDAPPHGNLYHNRDDKWKDGCPCQIQDESIFNAIDNMSIELKILALNNGLNMMIQRFKTLSNNIEIIEGENDVEFGNKLEEKIVKKIDQLEITAVKKDQSETQSRFKTNLTGKLF